MFQCVQPILALYALLQGFAALRRKAQVDGRLVNGYRICGCQDSNVMDIRLGRIAVTVTVNGNIIEDTDIDNVLPVSEII